VACLRWQVRPDTRKVRRVVRGFVPGAVSVAGEQELEADAVPRSAAAGEGGGAGGASGLGEGASAHRETGGVLQGVGGHTTAEEAGAAVASRQAARATHAAGSGAVAELSAAAARRAGTGGGCGGGGASVEDKLAMQETLLVGAGIGRQQLVQERLVLPEDETAPVAACPHSASEAPPARPAAGDAPVINYVRVRGEGSGSGGGGSVVLLHGFGTGLAVS